MTKRRTFLKEKLQGKGLAVCIAPRGVVGLGIANHQLEVGLKSKPILVHPSFQLSTHGAQVHWFFDNVEVPFGKSARFEGLRISDGLGGIVPYWVHWLTEENCVLIRSQFLQCIPGGPNIV